MTNTEYLELLKENQALKKAIKSLDTFFSDNYDPDKWYYDEPALTDEDRVTISKVWAEE